MNLRSNPIRHLSALSLALASVSIASAAFAQVAPEATPPAPAGDAPAATPPATTEAAPAEPVAEATPVVVEEKPAFPPKLSVGKEGFFQPSALLQFWFVNDHQDDNWDTTFRLRRAELRIKGEIIPKLVAYQVMIDPARALEFQDKTLDVEDQDPAPTTPGTVTAKQPASGSVSSIMQDFGVTFMSQYADVTVGQFKIPVSYEGFNGSSKTLFPERALVSRKYGDKRDIGVKAEKKLFSDMFYYNVGLYNGAGQNTLDTDDQKDLAIRLEGYPIKGLTIAAVGYWGLFDRDEVNTKDRGELDVKLEFGDLVALGEYIHAWDGPTGTNRTEGAGAYGQAGYMLLGRLQPIVRVGRLSSDIENDAPEGTNDEVWHYEAGANYYLQGQEARVGLTASLFDYDETPNKTEIIAFAQASF